MVKQRERKIIGGEIMFVNCTNHRVEFWSKKQLEEAEKYGEIVDIPFPNVSSRLTTEEVRKLAYEVVDKILKLAPEVVLCQGEFTLTYTVVTELKKHNIKVVAACSERTAEEYINEEGNNEKKSIFEFVQFREYE